MAHVTSQLSVIFTPVSGDGFAKLEEMAMGTFIGALAFAWVIVSLRDIFASDDKPPKIRDAYTVASRLAIDMHSSDVVRAAGCVGMEAWRSTSNAGTTKEWEWLDRSGKMLLVRFQDGSLVGWSIY
jgi:hypothetical protein